MPLIDGLIPFNNETQIQYLAIKPKNGGIPAIEKRDIVTKTLEIIEECFKSSKLLRLFSSLETPTKKINIVSI